MLDRTYSQLLFLFFPSFSNSFLICSSTSSHGSTSLRSSSSSTMGPEGHSRALIFLIAILNSSFPDYDFSFIEAREFRHETNVYTCMNTINTLLLSLVPGYISMKDALWRCLDEQIHFKDAEIYEFIPTLDSDPFRDMGATLHLCYFFYNPKNQRVLFWRSHSKRRRSHSLSESGRLLSRSMPASPNMVLPSGSSSSSFQDSFSTISSYPTSLTDDLDGFYSDSTSNQDSDDDPYLVDDDSATFNVDMWTASRPILHFTSSFVVSSHLFFSFFSWPSSSFWSLFIRPWCFFRAVCFSSSLV